MFAHRSVGTALTLLSCLAPESFAEIFNREVSTNHLYEFVLKIEGMFVRVAIDSYVPTIDGKPIFTPPYEGAIFPCLY